LYLGKQKGLIWVFCVLRGGDISQPHSDELVGARADDPLNLHVCRIPTYIALAAGIPAYDWRSPTREVPAPPLVKNGPFTELRLAPSPAAAVLDMIRERRSGSAQSMGQVLKDVQEAAIFRVEAPAVRILDCHSDGRLVGGVPELRKEGELARQRLGLPADDRERVASGAAAVVDPDREDRAVSEEWTALDAYFEQTVAAVQVPDTSKAHAIKSVWPLVGSIPRLETLVADHYLKLVFVGQSEVGLRELLRVRDVTGRKAHWHVAYFLAREMAHDLFSIRRKSGFGDWLKFATALLGALSGVGSISWLLSELISMLP
jgi:hypothetical protein